MSEDELVPVFNTLDGVEAVLFRSLLEEAGIDVEERPYETDWFEGVRQHGGLHSQLLVRATDAERARALIAAFREEAEQGELPADEAGDSGLS